MNKILHYGLLVIFFFIAMPLQAEIDIPREPTPNPLDELDIIQVIAPLLMVVVLIFALAWLVKKVNRGIPAMGKDIEVLSSTPLSSQSRLCLIRVGGKDMLIGVTATNISHLQTFDEPVAEIRPKENPVEFAEQFKKLLNRKSR